jgi:LuxR family transcriptional regulator, maltose regulon positive regulatory protein
MLEEPLVEIEKRGLYWTLMKLMPFKALALQALGREEEAIRVIDQCLAFAKTEGFVRIFIERGAPMVKLLQIALSRGIESEYINKLLPAFNTPPKLIPDLPKKTKMLDSANLIEPLSEQERKVLKLLNTHLSVPEIAREMVVAPSTIRTHVRNIYGKIGAHGRIEALEKAKELGLF